MQQNNLTGNNRHHNMLSYRRRLEATFKLSPLILAAYGGCFLIRKCAEIAFSKHQRSMLAGDMVKEIPTVFQTYLESQPET